MNLTDNQRILLLFALCFAIALYYGLSGNKPSNIGQANSSTGEVLGKQTPTATDSPLLKFFYR